MGWSKDYVHLTTLVLSLVCVNMQGDAPRLTLPSPAYYVNQIITLSCNSGISSGLLSVAITIEGDEFNAAFECKISLGVWNSTGQSNCTVHSPSSSVTVHGTTLLVEKMRSSTVTCIASYYNATLGTVPIKTVKTNAFSDAYVAPVTLGFDKFEFDDGVPVLNKKTRAHCKSSGGSPPSEYTYEVRSKIDSLVYNIAVVNDGDAEFEITNSLKNGFKVTCRDRVHTRGEISLTKQDCGGTGTEFCLPHYISPTVSRSQKVSFYLNHSYTLKCEVESHHTTLITYSWTVNGIAIPSETTATYILARNSNRTLIQETVSCTASLDKYGNVTITWNITWRTSSANTAIGVGVGVGVAVVIIAIILGIVLFKKKQDNSAQYQNTPAPVRVRVRIKRRKPSSQTTKDGHPVYSG